MGLELCLIIVTGDLPTMPFWLGHSMIETHRVGEVYEKIQELEESEGRHVPEEFNTFRGRLEKMYMEILSLDMPYDEVLEQMPPCYGNTQETPYGDVIKYVKAAPLVQAIESGLKAELNSGEPCNPYVGGPWAAVLGYLRGCRPDQKIALYWQ